MSTRPALAATRGRFRHSRKVRAGRRLLGTVVALAAGYLLGLGGVIWIARSSEATSAPQRADPPTATVRLAGDPRPDRTGTPALRVVPIRYPQRGTGTWAYAPARGRVTGRHGPMLRFRVAVERGITGLNAAGFATAADATLADRRSWVGTGRVRLRQVGPRDPADFTVFLVTPGTRELLCGGHDRYTSCRSGDRVVINVARWVHGAAAVAGPLAAYREYVINHEVGHRLGFGHERCPHRGAAAPVMQQQTLGLHGCRPNAWPAPGRTEYHGPTGSYDDPLPVGSSGRP